MRYRIVFISGLAIGFVLGARAGRERYEQLHGLARKAADSPAVQQAAGAMQARAADLARTTRSRIAERMPRMAGSARSAAGSLHERVPGMRGRRGPRPESDGHGHYAPAPGTTQGRPGPA